MALATVDKGSPRVRMVGHADLLVRLYTLEEYVVDVGVAVDEP